MDKLSTIKLDQALAWAGDVGRYYMGRTDINPQIRENLVLFLTVLQDYQQKTMVIALKELKERLVQVMATLEVMCPSFWNAPTAHGMLHIDHHMLSYGCFKAINGLVHERYMGKLKRLCQHGDKNKMQTLATQTHLFETANNWLLNKQYNSAYVVEMFIIYIHLYKFILFIH